MAKEKTTKTKGKTVTEAVATMRMDALVSVSVETSVLRTALERASMTSPRKGTPEIEFFRHFFVRTGERSIEVIATDMESGVRASYVADVGKGGMFMIPPAALKVIPLLSARVTLQVVKEREGLWLQLDSGAYQAKFPSMEVGDFLGYLPAESNFKKWVEIRQSLLVGMIDRTLFSVATDDSRYGLNGLFFEFMKPAGEGSKLRLVSTDGHRLSIVDAQIEIGEPIGSVLVARQLVKMWSKVWGGGTADSPMIKLEFGETFVRASAGDLQIWGRLLEGDFPDYKQVIPTNLPRKILVPHDKVLAMCQRSMVVTSTSHNAERMQTLRITLNPSDDGPGKCDVELSGFNPDFGEYRETITVTSQLPIEQPFKIGLNCRYLIDAMGAMDKPTFRICFSDGLGACMIDDAEDPSIRFVIMPVRLE